MTFRSLTSNDRKEPMKTLFKTIIDNIREDLGQPVRLKKLLDQHPEIRVALDTPQHLCIHANSIVQWQELGTTPASLWPRRERGRLMGWKFNGGHYESFELRRPEYEQIGQCEITTDWTCDITDVDGFSSSKSELRDFESTDKMVETNSRNMINEITHEMLAKNLAHNEIRIINSPNTSDHFARHLWDGRLFLMNSGGSHHFAAAKYIATRLPQSVTLRGKLYTYSLNAFAIASLRRDFEIFVISDETDVSLGFYEAMQAFRATWLWHHLPRPYENTKAVLLPKSEGRSMRVAALLREAGVTNLGAFLADLQKLPALENL